MMSNKHRPSPGINDHFLIEEASKEHILITENFLKMAAIIL
jgi:hypothetical protein